MTLPDFISHVNNNGLADAFSAPLEDVYNNVYLVEKSIPPDPSTYLTGGGYRSRLIFLPEGSRVLIRLPHLTDTTH